MHEEETRSTVTPDEPGYEELVRAESARSWRDLSPQLRELALHVALLTELYGFKESVR